MDKKLIIENDTGGESNGITLSFSSSIPTSGVGLIIRNAFKEALEEWCAATNINLKIGEDTDMTSVDLTDNINIITYGDCSGSGVACLNISGYTDCNTQTAIMADLDFEVVLGNSNTSFISYKNRFLHELGHAHMLNHSISPNWGNDWNYQYLMYHQTPPNNHISTITTSDEEGALLVFPNSDFCGGGISQGACGLNSISNQNFYDLIVYPNPFYNDIIIKSGLQNEVSNIILLDVLGNYIKIFDKNVSKICFDNYPSGMYLLRIELKGGEIKNLKILKQ